MNLRYTIVIFAAALTLFSCTSGKNRLEKGDYDTAVYKAVKRLGMRPDHRKATRVLKEAYVLAVDEHMRRARYIDETNELFKYDRMVQEYQAVQSLNNAVRRYPKYASVLELTTVNKELNFSREQAAISHAKEGDRLLGLGSKERARDAYYEYVRANDFLTGTVPYHFLDSAQELGTVNVAVEFDRDRNIFSGFQSDDLFYGLLNGIKDTRYTFLRIVDPATDDLEVDEYVKIEVSDAHIGGVMLSKDSKEVTKDNVFIGEAETDSGEVVKVYGKVSAEYVEFTKTINCRASVQFQRVRAGSGELLQQNVLGSTYTWAEKWATYKGDKRALSTEQLRIVEQREPIIPNPMWLFNETSRPLIGDGIDFFRTQYLYLR